jgi:hypothetical protein
MEIDNNIFEESSPRLKKNKESNQKIELTDRHYNHSAKKIQGSLNASALKNTLQSEDKENMKSELKII